ncbi:alcohol dehydrogenase GroES-like domain protein [Mycobacteroides abscessus subsp. bolletii 1513]|uniref:alcohol dehydrogenase n=1 Tax=Mycobacteroides abscessus subsp. bolletii 1513 TaxID=1299321 RepID=X8DYF8_9MYCO|nr:alcohol dehydrogenase GroES-like domain protein [Mycobacteroides abscessus subsp. bolletii 1513]
MRIRSAVLHAAPIERPYRDTRPLKVIELELDPPGPGEVLVRIEAAGLCHSDLSVVDGNRIRPVPMALGHEAAGVIAAVGPACATSPPVTMWCWCTYRAAARAGTAHPAGRRYARTPPRRTAAVT